MTEADKSFTLGVFMCTCVRVYDRVCVRESR
jgi:hypothetical protein